MALTQAKQLPLSPVQKRGCPGLQDNPRRPMQVSASALWAAGRLSVSLVSTHKMSVAPQL